MSQVITTQRLTRASLRPKEDVRTVLLRMAANQDRAERLKLLKQQTPGVTWRQLAEHAGVVERSVYGWIKTGAMEFDNAKKIAEFFSEHGHDTDARWLYFGDPDAVPDVMSALRTDTTKAPEWARQLQASLDALVALAIGTTTPDALRAELEAGLEARAQEEPRSRRLGEPGEPSEHDPGRPRRAR